MVLGLVVQTYPGKDGIVRACKVRTKKGDLLRPVQRLHCLEFDTEASSASSSSSENSVPSVDVDRQDAVRISPSGSLDITSVTRSGRVYKPINK